MTRTLRAEGPAPTLQGPFAGRDWARYRRRSHQGRGREAQCRQLAMGVRAPRLLKEHREEESPSADRQPQLAGQGSWTGNKGPGKEGDPG